MKWGILATGTIAKKFASTVEQMGAEGEQLVAVGSRHLESAQAFAQQYGIPRCYDSYEALAADPEVEAIYIATPNTLHYENCKLCLEQGKHVLCEKPFTVNPEQAREHPMVDVHYIQWLIVETENGGQLRTLAPGQAPRAVFELGGEKPVAVYAYCNLHGLWMTKL